MANSIILFRFNRQYDVCEQNLDILKAQNPETDIYGLYGGEDNIEDLPLSLLELLQGCWKIPLDDPFYKWRNGDLCVRMWFRELSREIDFKHLFLIDWDILFSKPLKDIYPVLEENTNYGALWGSYHKAKETSWNWVSGVREKEVTHLAAYLKDNYKAVDFDKVMIGWMGGAVLCRVFLEELLKKPVPSFSNDELRLGVYSQVLGIPLLDNGFFQNDKNRIIVKTGLSKQLAEDNIYLGLENKADVIHPVTTIIPDLKNSILKS